tara:strand:+ start:78 stop:293 length:216 start_codon:yes stop_codon:yes gene_type:complete
MMKFNKGDLVKSNHNTPVFDEKEWYGIILDACKDAPQKHPILANKYKIKWCGGTTSWLFGHSIVLVSRAKK